MSIALAWGARVSAEFRERVVAIAVRVGFDPSWLMGCIAFETGRTFSPSIKNAAGSGATGLIQFMPRTAIGLGTTVAELERMTALKQLDYVEKYFLPFTGRIHTFADCYMAILMPTAVGKSDDTVLIEDDDGKAYIQNRGLDLNQDGNITKAEAAASARRQWEAGLTPENAIGIDYEAQVEVQAEAQSQGNDMGAGLLMGLIQAVIGGFAPLAQQKLSGALEKHGADPTAATAIMGGVLNAIATVTGTNAQTLRDDPKAAIAAISTVQSSPAMMQAVERDSLAELDKLAPVLDKLHTISKEEWAAEEESKQAVFLRNKEDPSQNIQKPLMTFTMVLVAIITVFTGGLLGYQMHLAEGAEPNGQIIILFVMLCTTFVNMLRTQNDWGFGSSRSSAAKDETIKQMAKLK